MITAEIQAEILTAYFSEKKSVRYIAHKLGLNRRSVRRVLERRSIQEGRAKPARTSILDPYKEEIKAILAKDQDVTNTSIMNRMRLLGYLGGRSTLNDYMRKLRQARLRPKEAFLRLEFSPGETAQVDWGEFGDVFGDGVKNSLFCHGTLLFSLHVY